MIEINQENKEDKDLLELMEIYYDDPVLFCRQILHIEPDEQQEEMLYALRDNKKATAKSGRGAGKTFGAGMGIWWFLNTRFNAQVYITAASGGTIQGAIWPTIAKLHQEMDPLFKNCWDLQTTQVKRKQYPATWFCLSRTARKESPESLAGAHAENLLYIIDEASGVDDAIFKSVFGSLTEEENYLLMLSNPRRLSGFFFESHRPYSSTIYKQITMSAIKSRWVTDKSIESWKRMYGEESNTYRVEVLGEFPTKETDSIIDYDQVIAATERKKNGEGPILWGIDVGGGFDKSVLIKRRDNKVWKSIKEWKDKDTMKLVGRIVSEYEKTPKQNRPAKIFIDSIAIGKGPSDRLKELGLPIVATNVSTKAKNKKFYVNLKAELWSNLRDWFRDAEPDVPYNADLIEQLTTVRQEFHSSGKFLIESKDKYKKRNPQIGSPDLADALALTFNMKGLHKAQDSVFFV